MAKKYPKRLLKNSKLSSLLAGFALLLVFFTADIFAPDDFSFRTPEAEAIVAPFTFTQNTALSFGIYSHPTSNTASSITLIAGGCTVNVKWTQLGGTCVAPNITIKDPNNVATTICIAIAKVSSGNAGFDLIGLQFKWHNTTVAASNQCGLVNPGTAGKILIIRANGTATTSVGDGANTMTYQVAVTYG